MKMFIELGTEQIDLKYNPKNDPYSPQFCGGCYRASKFLPNKNFT
jgi:hypothetical protein